MQSQRVLLAVVTVALLAVVAVMLLLPRPGPVSAAGIAAVVAGSASGHTCAVTATGGVKCWGRNDYGQLGDGSTTDRATPVAVQGLESDVVGVATGSSHTCAVTTAGALTCWGRNTHGQLGDGRACGIVCVTPVDVVGLETGVVSVAAGYAHTCALTTAGGVKCWGNNFHGQVGTGEIGNVRDTPVDVALLTSGVAAFAVGDWHTCAVTTAGGLKCWGENLNGQLGDGTTGTNRTTPVNVSGLGSGVAAVAAGGLHTCALTAAGGVRCWGRNDFGQVGDGTIGGIHSVPVDVADLGSDVTYLAVGYEHSCAVIGTGGASCWGRNEFGRLGDGTTTGRAVPTAVSGLASAVASVAAGTAHTCALTIAGSAKCWGRNNFGQLGDGTFTNRTAPVSLVGVKLTPTLTPSLTPTGTSTPIPTITPTPTPDCPDSDGDTLNDCAELFYNTDPNDPDSDGDGCADGVELRTAVGSEFSGGRRDPVYPWDYFNPTGDGVNRSDDILDVVLNYRQDANLPSGPPDPGYSTDRDRGPLVGPNDWDFGAPDGVIRSFDILAAVVSYRHDCGPYG